MNREIKFRGKSLSTGEWVYGYYYATPMRFLDKPDVVTHCIVDADGRIYKVDPKTVGQWVGVEDKNKVKIFEGDVVEHVPRNEAKYVVKYLTSGFYLCPNNKDFGEYFASLFAGYDDNRTCNYLEVIDNIYDNSELLTQ